VAILVGGDTGEEIGIGAILGAPFMLSTLAMFVVGNVEAAEATGEIAPLYFRRWIQRLRGKREEGRSPPSTWASITQALVAIAGMIAGARIFVLGIDRIASTFSIPPLALALLIAPIATELPEKFNSVIWVRRRKDTLALGNITGAMVFQSSFPVTIGLLLTPLAVHRPRERGLTGRRPRRPDGRVGSLADDQVSGKSGPPVVVGAGGVLRGLRRVRSGQAAVVDRTAQPTTPSWRMSA
jgi:hypothetical protein